MYTHARAILFSMLLDYIIYNIATLNNILAA